VILSEFYKNKTENFVFVVSGDFKFRVCKM